MKEACLCLPHMKSPKLRNVQHCQGVLHSKTSLLSAAAVEIYLKRTPRIKGGWPGQKHGSRKCFEKIIMA